MKRKNEAVESRKSDRENNKKAKKKVTRFKRQNKQGRE